MEPGALRRRLDDIYLHRRELGAASAPATRTCVAADVAETQPMSEEIRFRLDIWPLQQMGVLADFSFLWTIAARDSHVELIYQEHLLEWMHVGNLLDDLACCLGAPRGDHRFEDAVCIAAKEQRRCAADGELSSPCELRRFHNGEKLTLLRKLADDTSAVSLVACPSKAGKRMLAEFWMPRLEPRLSACGDPTGFPLLSENLDLGVALRVVSSMPGAWTVESVASSQSCIPVRGV